MVVTYEYCPHCDTEVQLDAELKVQTCPHCGRRIVTCSMCRACDESKPYCVNCCLERQAQLENEDYENEELYSVWVGGGEVNSYYVTRKEAESIAERCRAKGYDDVVISMKD